MKYAAFIRYGNPEKIAEVRPTHRQYLSQLKEAGKLWASGPFTDDSGALIIYETESEEEARQLIERRLAQWVERLLRGHLGCTPRPVAQQMPEPPTEQWQ